jgi:diadenosine tetraphosphate (Ap4A) HIT family hydrolase
MIHRTGHWAVEHCIGPLGVGSLVVKPIRHIVHVADLQDDEMREMGPLLRQAARAVTALTDAEQVYVCLWSHADRRPGHIHFVVQPVSGKTMRQFDAHGPELQVAMFHSAAVPDTAEIDAFSARARSWFVAEEAGA